MIARIWTTEIKPEGADDYATFVESESIPMFRKQEGFCGALFLGSGKRRIVLTLWRDERAAAQVAASPTYLDCVRRIVAMGFLYEQHLDVQEITRTLFPSGLGVLDLPGGEVRNERARGEP